jgi:hypothetical protein
MREFALRLRRTLSGEESRALLDRVPGAGWVEDLPAGPVLYCKSETEPGQDIGPDVSRAADAVCTVLSCARSDVVLEDRR